VSLVTVAGCPPQTLFRRKLPHNSARSGRRGQGVRVSGGIQRNQLGATAATRAVSDREYGTFWRILVDLRPLKILTTATFSEHSSCESITKPGVSCRYGRHHVAQKFSRTICPRCSLSRHFPPRYSENVKSRTCSRRFSSTSARDAADQRSEKRATIRTTTTTTVTASASRAVSGSRKVKLQPCKTRVSKKGVVIC
jgi:hypothetical protein